LAEGFQKGIERMGDRKTIILLILLMVFVGAGVGGIILARLYESDMDGRKINLMEMVKAQARLMEAVARFDLRYSRDDVPGGALSAALSQITGVFDRMEGFGATGEFVLGTLENGQIRFLWGKGRKAKSRPQSIPMATSWAEPMRRALKGESGMAILSDYAGDRVLAAYEPVRFLNLGIVAKVNLEEIRKPFFVAASFAGIGAGFLILIGAGIFHKIHSSLMRRLEESEEKYRSLFTRSSDAVFLLDQGVLVDCNERMCQFLGQPRESCLGKTLASFSAPLQAPDGPSPELLRGSSMPGEDAPAPFKWKFRDAHQNILDTEVTLKTIRIGGHDLFLGTIRDIRERMQWEKMLLDREELLKNIINETSAIIYIKDLEGRYTLVNRQFEKLWKLNREQVLGQTDHELFPESAGQFAENDARVLNLRCPLRFDEMVLVDGVWHTYLSVKFPLKDSSGVTHGVCGISTDITERKRVEEEFKTLFTAVEQSPVTITITNLEGVIEYVNPRFVQLTGYSRLEAIGKKTSILKSGHHPEDFYANLWSTVLAHKTWNGEFLNKKKNGDLYWEQASISPILDEKGIITYFLAVKEDVTEKKLAEENLKRAQTELILSEKLAGIGRLAAGVCHEILNPLNIISIHIQMLMKKGVDSIPPQETLAKMMKEVHRIEKISQSLLVFARKGESRKVKIVIRDEMTEIISLYEKEFALNNIRMVCDFPANAITIQADPDEIRQVLLNIVNNALYSMKGGGQLTFKIWESSIQSRKWGHISISDTGGGIKREHFDHIFDPFFTTKPHGEGTGMGLSVSRTLVEKQGGKLEVENHLGKGATFIISLLQG